MKGTGPTKRESVLVINRNWCKGCGICAAFCPGIVLALDGDGKISAVREEACTSCGLCVILCPDFALSLEDRSEGEAAE